MNATALSNNATKLADTGGEGGALAADNTTSDDAVIVKPLPVESAVAAPPAIPFASRERTSPLRRCTFADFTRPTPAWLAANSATFTN